MIYYRTDFVAAKLISRPSERFRTEEKAKKHARRVLGVADDSAIWIQGSRSSPSAETELRSDPARKVWRHS